jgi:hypothetical protein
LRIPLQFDDDKERLSVIASIRFSKKAPIPVLFIVDTGSPVTFVDEFVSSKIRVYANTLPFDHDALMGGSKIAMHSAGNVEMSFIDETDMLARLESGMFVAKTEWTRKGKIYSGTSIIGLDFFLKNKAKLFVDPYNNIAYIEK